MASTVIRLARTGDVTVQVIDSQGRESTQHVYLMEDSPDVTCAYQRDPDPRIEKVPKLGYVLLANMLFRDRGNQDRIVFLQSDTRVAIQHAELATDQMLDEQHVLLCHEALRDDRFMFIVTLLPPRPIHGFPVMRDETIHVIDGHGNEATEQVLVDDSPNSIQAYQFMPDRVDGENVGLANILLKSGQRNGHIVFRRTYTNVSIQRLSRQEEEGEEEEAYWYDSLTYQGVRSVVVMQGHGPVIHDAVTDSIVQVIDEHGNETPHQVFLRNNSPNVSQVYQEVSPATGFPRVPIPLGSHGERGVVVFARVFLRDQRGDNRLVFRRSDTYVAIKKLDRSYFDRRILTQLRGGRPTSENPYAEISIMQRFGNDQHIMSCCEALRDDQHLYVVTHFAPNGDLHRNIAWGFRGGYRGGPVRAVARQLLINLQQLRTHRLVHRDLKPENILCEFRAGLHPFIDFAMALQSSYFDGLERIPSQGRAGTPYYISPEVYRGLPFDRKADMWAYGCILFNLLTGLRVFRLPVETDKCLQFFIQDGGWEDSDLCQWKLDELRATSIADGRLGWCIQAVQNLDPNQRNLLRRVFQFLPENRPEVDDLLNHPFFHGVP